MTDSKGMDLGEVLASVAKKMLSDFEASGAVQHRGSKGTVRESNLLDNYLRKYLPGTVTAVHSGEAVTVNGQVSAQCDIMILDPSTPPFWDEDSYRVVPIECVYGVIEVKSFLDSTQDRRHQVSGEEGFPSTTARLGPHAQRLRPDVGLRTDERHRVRL